MKRNYTGFTLAEVLITLGIIGIVASMTLPSLVGKYKKSEMETRLKKTYTVLSQALLMSIAKDGQLSLESFKDADHDSVKNWYQYYLKPYIKVMKECYQESGCWHEGKTLNLNGTITDYTKDSIGIGNHIMNFLTIDGVAVNIDGSEQLMLTIVLAQNLIQVLRWCFS